MDYLSLQEANEKKEPDEEVGQQNWWRRGMEELQDPQKQGHFELTTREACLLRIVNIKSILKTMGRMERDEQALGQEQRNWGSNQY